MLSRLISTRGTRAVFGAKSLHASAAVSGESSTFVKQRATYEEQLTTLRKEWSKGYESKVEEESKRKKADKDQVVLETAMRLRQKRIRKAADMERDRAARAAAMQRYKEKLAKNMVLKNIENQRAELRFKQLVADLVEEQKVWITAENMDKVITPELFSAPQATTGLITRQSDHWRYFAHPDSYKRNMAEIRALPGEDDNGNMMPDETYKFRLGSPDEVWEDRQSEIFQQRSQSRLQIEESLNSLIGTSEERANYESLVRRYVAATNADEAAIAEGHNMRQERLMDLEEEGDEVKVAAKSTDRPSYDDDRNAIVERFRSSMPELPGEAGVAFTALRKHADRVVCREDFDDLVDRYIAFYEQHGQSVDLNVKLVSDAELITNADYLDRTAYRLGSMVEAAKSADAANSYDAKFYSIKLKSYREDWWKFQALLVLAGRVEECSLCEDFPDSLE